MIGARTRALADGNYWLSLDTLRKYWEFMGRPELDVRTELSAQQYYALVMEVRETVIKAFELPPELVQLFHFMDLSKIAKRLHSRRPAKSRRQRVYRKQVEDEDADDADESPRRLRVGLTQYRYNPEVGLVYILDNTVVITAIIPDEGQQKALDVYCGQREQARLEALSRRVVSDVIAIANVVDPAAGAQLRSTQAQIEILIVEEQELEGARFISPNAQAIKPWLQSDEHVQRHPEMDIWAPPEFMDYALGLCDSRPEIRLRPLPDDLRAWQSFIRDMDRERHTLVCVSGQQAFLLLAKLMQAELLDSSMWLKKHECEPEPGLVFHIRLRERSLSSYRFPR